MSLERLREIFKKKEQEPFAGTHATISLLYLKLPNECKYTDTVCASAETVLPKDLSDLLSIQDKSKQKIHISAFVDEEESWIFVGTNDSNIKFIFERNGDKVRKITLQRNTEGNFDEDEILSPEQNPLYWNAFMQAVEVGMKAEGNLVGWSCPAKENGLPGSVV